jgi:hypothetical protein
VGFAITASTFKLFGPQGPQIYIHLQGGNHSPLTAAALLLPLLLLQQLQQLQQHSRERASGGMTNGGGGGDNTLLGAHALAPPPPKRKSPAPPAQRPVQVQAQHTGRVVGLASSVSAAPALAPTHLAVPVLPVLPVLSPPHLPPSIASHYKATTHSLHQGGSQATTVAAAPCCYVSSGKQRMN